MFVVSMGDRNIVILHINTESIVISGEVWTQEEKPIDFKKLRNNTRKKVARRIVEDVK